MESISRNVGDLTANERQVYEAALGHPLQAGQQIVVQVIDVETNGESNVGEVAVSQDGDVKFQLPEWCAVYRGLSDEEVDAVEQSILARSPASRQVDVDF